MVDDIEMARPKGLLIPFDKFVILDILPPEQYKNVLTKMRQYVEPVSYTHLRAHET